MDEYNAMCTVLTLMQDKADAIKRTDPIDMCEVKAMEASVNGLLKICLLIGIRSPVFQSIKKAEYAQLRLIYDENRKTILDGPEPMNMITLCYKLKFTLHGIMSSKR
jgi:hypothetical protein